MRTRPAVSSRAGRTCCWWRRSSTRSNAKGPRSSRSRKSFEAAGLRRPVLLSGTIGRPVRAELSRQTPEAVLVLRPPRRPWSIGLNCALGATGAPAVRSAGKARPRRRTCASPPTRTRASQRVGGYDEAPDPDRRRPCRVRARRAGSTWSAGCSARSRPSPGGGSRPSGECRRGIRFPMLPRRTRLAPGLEAVEESGPDSRFVTSGKTTNGHGLAAFAKRIPPGDFSMRGGDRARPGGETARASSTWNMTRRRCWYSGGGLTRFPWT